MARPTLLTVVLNYRTPEMTLRSVEAALRETAGLSGEVVVVDNDSGDGSEAILRSAVASKGWARVRVIQTGHNGGFGAGNNAGIQAGLSDGSRPDFVYVLNSDAFPDAGAVERLYSMLEANPAVGLVGSYIHGPDGVPHVTSFRFPSIASEFEGAARLRIVSRLLGHRAVPIPVPEATRPVDWLAGASLMVRREVLDEIGVFDERFFLYFEETDLCRRAYEAGWPTLYVRDSEVTHIGSASTGMKTWEQTPDFWYDSRWHYFAKTHGRVYALLATVAHLAGGTLHRLRCLLARRAPVDPPGHLRRLASHALRSLMLRSRRSEPIKNGLGMTSKGDV